MRRFDVPRNRSARIQDGEIEKIRLIPSSQEEGGTTVARKIAPGGASGVSGIANPQDGRLIVEAIQTV